MKNNRQREILDIISTKSVETQGELIDELRKRGYDATQATVSRDIKELKLIKSSDANSKYRYIQSAAEEAKNVIKFGSILNDTIADSYIAGTIVVIKTHNGMAMAAATAIDSLGFDEILGTIAGDDTIFIAVSNMDSAATLTKRLSDIAQKDKSGKKAY